MFQTVHIYSQMLAIGDAPYEQTSVECSQAVTAKHTNLCHQVRTGKKKYKEKITFTFLKMFYKYYAWLSKLQICLLKIFKICMHTFLFVLIIIPT